jgi:aminoglycoside phosphotransferase (APT) family kinase protein
VDERAGTRVDERAGDTGRDSDGGGRLSAYVGVIATAWDGSFGRDAVTLHPGHDYDVVLVGTRAAFRFPRHQAALDALPREVAALAGLGATPGTDLADVLPDVFLDRSGDSLGRAFLGQRVLPGEPLPRASVDAVGPMAYRFAAELARVLDALAAVTVTADLMKTLTQAPMRTSFPELAETVRADLYPTMTSAERHATDAALDAVLDIAPPATPSLVHGDFVGRNLRWDADETRLTGVLDWGQVHLGDPAYDIASVADTYGWDLASTVAAATARDDDDAVVRARAYAATFPLQRALAQRR